MPPVFAGVKPALPLEQCCRLEVRRSGEHIHESGLDNLEPAFLEKRDISRQRVRRTGYVEK